MSSPNEESALNQFISNFSNYANGTQLNTLFPSALFTRAGLARFQSCIGFLAGLKVGGKTELAEKLAEQLMYSMRLHAPAKVERTKLDGVHGLSSNGSKDRYVRFHDDGTFLGFSFVVYNLAHDQSLFTEDYIKSLDRQPDRIGEYKSSIVKPWYYLGYNGCILFHGFQQVFSTNLDNSIGWRSHT